MGAPVRRRASSRGVQRALVVVLLALIGLFGVAAEQSPAQATTISTTTGAVPAAESLVLPHGTPAAATDDAGSHAHDTISLLCLCALVMVGVLLVTRRGTPPHTSARRARTTTPASTTSRGVFPTTPTDPLSWGVCRR